MGITLDEVITRVEEAAEENQRVVDTGIVFDDVTIDMLYCDDTELIEEHLANYQKCAKEQRQLAEWLKDYKRLKELEPCEDVIRREDAINAVSEALEHVVVENEDVARKMINKLPSVNPQPKTRHWPKTGHWVYKIYGGFHEQGNWYCSHCDYQYNYGNGHAKFCPECGLKMSEPSTEEVIRDKDYDWVIKR